LKLLLSKLLFDSILWLKDDEYFKFSSFTSELYDEVENFEEEKVEFSKFADFLFGVEFSVVDGFLPESNEGARRAENDPNSFTGSIFVETFLSLIDARIMLESSSSNCLLET